MAEALALNAKVLGLCHRIRGGAAFLGAFLGFGVHSLARSLDLDHVFGHGVLA